MSSSKIESVFFANSTYSLLEYLLQMPAKQNKTLEECVQSTLFVNGPAIAGVQVPQDNKILWDKTMDPKAVLAQVLEKTPLENKSIYLNLRAEVSAPVMDLKVPFFILSDGLGDHETFPAIIKNPMVIKCYSSPDILKTLQDDKLETFEMRALWREADSETRQGITRIFDVPTEALEKASSRSVVLATQPISEDNMMTEADKIELFRRIMTEHGMENIVIKPHPREVTPWAELFPDIPVIPRKVPMELLCHLTPIDRIASFFSTSSFGTLPDDHVYFYAKDFAQLKSFHPEKEFDEEGHKSVAGKDIEKENQDHTCIWRRIPDPDGRFYRVTKVASQPMHLPNRNITLMRVYA